MSGSTLLPGVLQDLNCCEVPLHALSITAKLGIAGLLALVIQDAARLQGIPTAYLGLQAKEVSGNVLQLHGFQ